MLQGGVQLNLQEHPGGKTTPDNKKTTNNVQASANLVQGNASKVSPINQGFLDGLLPAQWDTFSQGCIGQRFQGSLEDLTLPHFTRSVSPSALEEKQLQLTLIPQAVNVMTVPTVPHYTRLPKQFGGLEQEAQLFIPFVVLS